MKVNYILQLKELQRNKCIGCGVEMLWEYVPKDMQQFDGLA